MPPDKEFPFRRLLRLAGLRRRYSNPPPHGESSYVFRRKIISAVDTASLQRRY
jgi:hypothetical protein